MLTYADMSQVERRKAEAEKQLETVYKEMESFRQEGEQVSTLTHADVCYTSGKC